MKRCKQDVQRVTRAGLADLTLLVALAAGVGARGDYPCHGGCIHNLMARSFTTRNANSVL